MWSASSIAFGSVARQKCHCGTTSWRKTDQFLEARREVSRVEGDRWAGERESGEKEVKDNIGPIPLNEALPISLPPKTKGLLITKMMQV